MKSGINKLKKNYENQQIVKQQTGNSKYNQMSELSEEESIALKLLKQIYETNCEGIANYVEYNRPPAQKTSLQYHN